MPNIKIKTSTTGGSVPPDGSLLQGELAANLADEIVYVGDADGDPIKIVDSFGKQDDNAVNITGGSIANTSVTATNVNASGIVLTNSERLYYDEGTRADLFTSNWNDSFTTNMADFGGLGDVTAHGWQAGPRSYTLSLSGLPAHTQVRYQVYWHLVESVDNEQNALYTTDTNGAEVTRLTFTKNYSIIPAISTRATGTTDSWHGNRWYSYSPWNGSQNGSSQANGAGSGYLIIDTGWYDHAASSFSARHYTAVEQAITDEAVYLSHVKLWIRGQSPSISSVDTSSSITKTTTALPTSAAVKSYIDSNLKGMVKNVLVYGGGSHTYNKSGSDVKKLKVVCVGGGGGGRGYGESGGAGGYAEKIIDASSVSSVSITVGGAGGGGNYFGNSPAGGTTSFGSYVSASGGFGANNHGSHIGGHGGNGSGGQVNSYGGGGKGHNNGVNNPSNSAVGWGGQAYYGGSRNSHHNSPRPGDHGAPGGGGTGSVGGSGGSGSSGRDGVCIVYELR